MYDFEIFQPRSLIGALELKKKYGADLHPLAGGTDVLVSVKNNRVNWGNKPRLLDLNNLKSELHFINESTKTIEIGSLVTHSEIIGNNLIDNHVPALKKALSLIGSPQIRNRGTLTGNMVHASPAADSLPILYARDAQVEIQTLHSIKKILISDFITGPGLVDLDPTGIVTKIIIPKLPDYTGDYLSLRQRRALSCNVVSVGIELLKYENVIEDIRIGLGAVSPTVVRGKKTEELLKRKLLTEELLGEAEILIQTECNPITDVRSNMDYRRAMIGVLLRRFLQKHLDLK
ncbi:MAG: FAD binding domain-containing protein [Candidatus Hodarchaeota archaeon]